MVPCSLHLLPVLLAMCILLSVAEIQPSEHLNCEKVCSTLEKQVACLQVLACGKSQAATVVPVPTEDIPAHRAFKALAEMRKRAVKTLLLGDSITKFYGTPEGRMLLRKYLGVKTVAAFGVPGDTTQKLLWRLSEGETSGLSPLLIIVLIGSNNVAHGSSPDEVLAGLAAVAEKLLQLHSDAQVLMMGILPRKCNKEDCLISIKEINRRFKGVADARPSPRLHYVDCGSIFMTPAQTINSDLMPDGTHPSHTGMKEMFAHCLAPFLQKEISLPHLNATISRVMQNPLPTGTPLDPHTPSSTRHTNAAEISSLNTGTPPPPSSTSAPQGTPGVVVPQSIGLNLPDIPVPLPQRVVQLAIPLLMTILPLIVVYRIQRKR